MIMGRNKRKAFQDNGANSDTDSMLMPKKKKESSDAEPIAKAAKCNKKHKNPGSVNSSERDSKKIRQNIYTDSSSSSESDSEKNSVKKSERSVTDSNSESGSDSDSDSSGSESSRGSKSVAPNSGKQENSVVNLNPVPEGKTYVETTPKSSGSDSYHSDTEEEDKKRRKKQKELIKQQLTKRNKRGSPRKQETVFSKKEENEETEEEDIPPPADDVLDWPESDVLELIHRMEVQIPEGDTQKFDSRAARLDWEKIAFGNYSKQECQNTWNRISKRIRRFRKLSEILQDAKEWAKKPWTNFYRGSKKNQHPDMPTKPLSAYMIYYQEHKKKVMEENKGADMMQISKIMTEMYKNLTDVERERYSQKATREKQMFEEKTSEFYRDHPEVGPPPQTANQLKALAKEAIKGPKKPYPPFKLFFQEELKNAAVDGLVDKKLVEENAREKWRNFSDKKKGEYIKMSLAELNRFEIELKAYKLQHPDFAPPNYNKNILNKEERLILQRLSGKPVKPPNSAYSLFSRYMLQSNTEVKSKAPKLRMAEISRKWKELSAPEKHKYELNVKELQEDYKTKLQQYFKSLTQEEREREAYSVKKEKKKEETTHKEFKTPETKLKKIDDEEFYYQILKEEPKRPPMEAYDLFVEKFLAEKPSGISEEERLKQAPEFWEKLPESKKEALEEELAVIKQKYVSDFGDFLKKLSPEQLKALSLRREKEQKEEQQMQRMNGTLSDSNDESDEEKYESSCDGSDTDDSESVKSKKNGSESKSSSSDDSDG